jgi:amidase
MTVKEALNVAGLHTTWGDPAFRTFVADSDATVVSRLQRAGAVIVGKTNVAYLLGDFGQTANELYGVTNNPWDTALTPGGSSGGAAAAVAAGLSFLDYGTDLVGSVRLPAGLCGVYGLKPSVETVPLTGFQPPGAAAAAHGMTYLSSVGPLGRAPADLRAALRATAGPEGSAARAYRWMLPPPRRTRLRDFRVGVVLDDRSIPVSGEVGAALSDAVDALARSGATVVTGWPSGIDPSRQAGSFGFQARLFFAFQQGTAGGLALDEVIEQEQRRLAARAVWADYFEDVDVFLCPLSFTAAFPHDVRPFDERTISTPEGDRPYQDLAFWIAHASLSGLPALAAPIGRTTAGLPIAAQILGPLYEDDTPLTFADLLADIAGGYERPPI